MHRIFIVEDDESIATAIKSQIESWGCEAQRVQDFRNVLSECIAYQPHLVLMDIALLSLTVTTGVRKYAATARCPSSLSLLPRII